MTHELKTWPRYFAAVASGRRAFELRRDDRPFEEGDEVVLREYDPARGGYTGAEARGRITYILRGDSQDPSACGIEEGYVVLGLGGLSTVTIGRAEAEALIADMRATAHVRWEEENGCRASEMLYVAADRIERALGGK